MLCGKCAQRICHITSSIVCAASPREHPAKEGEAAEHQTGSELHCAIIVKIAKKHAKKGLCLWTSRYVFMHTIHVYFSMLLTSDVHCIYKCICIISKHEPANYL